jgi:hypothetical protein
MATLPSCLSRARFGAFLAYSPRGQSEDSAKSRRITYAIKNAKVGIIKKAVDKLRAELKPGGFAEALRELFGEGVVVVPCPRSAPLVKGALWPPKEICDELVRQGLALETAAVLERMTAVKKGRSRSTAPIRTATRKG